MYSAGKDAAKKDDTSRNELEVRLAEARAKIADLETELEEVNVADDLAALNIEEMAPNQNMFDPLTQQSLAVSDPSASCVIVSSADLNEKHQHDDITLGPEQRPVGLAYTLQAEHFNVSNNDQIG